MKPSDIILHSCSASLQLGEEKAVCRGQSLPGRGQGPIFPSSNEPCQILAAALERDISHLFAHHP